MKEPGEQPKHPVDVVKEAFNVGIKYPVHTLACKDLPNRSARVLRCMSLFPAILTMTSDIGHHFVGDWKSTPSDSIDSNRSGSTNVQATDALCESPRKRSQDETENWQSAIPRAKQNVQASNARIVIGLRRISCCVSQHSMASVATTAGQYSIA